MSTVTTVNLVSREDFYSAVRSITYRNQDVTEAFQFGCSSIEACYNKAKHRFAKYYVVEQNNLPVVTVMLQRDGYIIFFISAHVENKVALIRKLRKLARVTVRRCGAIITKTANWYGEANRLNRLIGFRKYQIYDNYTYWVKE